LIELSIEYVVVFTLMHYIKLTCSDNYPILNTVFEISLKNHVKQMSI